MCASNVLVEDAKFIQRAKAADDAEKVKDCVDRGLRLLQMFKQSKEDAIGQLENVVVTATTNKAGSTSPSADPARGNLFLLFAELQERRKAL